MKRAYCLFFLALHVTSTALLTGCIGLDEEEGGEDIAVREEKVAALNSLTVNALTSNALTTNALTTNALTTNALTTNALTTNALVYDALRDGATRQFLSYVVGCALPSGSDVAVTIDGVSYVFEGQVGLASKWGESGGKCDSACRSWVSACVLSRVNYLGVQVPISIRGKKAELAPGLAERTEYPHREATYYGDVFSQPQVRYACLSPGETTNPRVCGPSLDDCVMDVIGSCDAACDSPESTGAFPNCREQTRNPADGKFPKGTKSFAGSITVFLKP